ncbi:hypothetical protein PR048_027535 [Dryococelus australis]|uniref:Uncharacterized protein n=1 Tax=Dryococelus australis TaxID=614101 RepID=A0ABQ9GGS7_9NEOP|nr:hypothetical protein PR048_027535 [Dryococelus australis]
MRVIEVNMERRRNEGAGGGGETGDPRENPRTIGIVRNDSHTQDPELQSLFLRRSNVGGFCMKGSDWERPCELTLCCTARASKELMELFLERHEHSVRAPPTRGLECVAVCWEIRFFDETFPPASNRLDCSLPTKANWVQILGRVTPGFSQVGIPPDDAAGRAGFPADLPLPQPLRSGAAPFSPHFTLIVSQYLVSRRRISAKVFWSAHSHGNYLREKVPLGMTEGRLQHRGSKLDLRSYLRSTLRTGAPFEFRAGLEIEIEFISNHRNWRFEILIRDQQPSSTNNDESESQNHKISLVQDIYIGTKIKLDSGSELGSFDLGSGAMLVQPALRFIILWLGTRHSLRRPASLSCLMPKRALLTLGEPDSGDPLALVDAAADARRLISGLQSMVGCCGSSSRSCISRIVSSSELASWSLLQQHASSQL